MSIITMSWRRSRVPGLSSLINPATLVIILLSQIKWLSPLSQMHMPLETSGCRCASGSTAASWKRTGVCRRQAQFTLQGTLKRSWHPNPRVWYIVLQCGTVYGGGGGLGGGLPGGGGGGSSCGESGISASDWSDSLSLPYPPMSPPMLADCIPMPFAAADTGGLGFASAGGTAPRAPAAGATPSCARTRLHAPLHGPPARRKANRASDAWRVTMRISSIAGLGDAASDLAVCVMSLRMSAGGWGRVSSCRRRKRKATNLCVISLPLGPLLGLLRFAVFSLALAQPLFPQRLNEEFAPRRIVRSDLLVTRDVEHLFRVRGQRPRAGQRAGRRRGPCTRKRSNEVQDVVAGVSGAQRASTYRSAQISGSDGSPLSRLIRRGECDRPSGRRSSASYPRMYALGGKAGAGLSLSRSSYQCRRSPACRLLPGRWRLDLPMEGWSMHRRSCNVVADGVWRWRGAVRLWSYTCELWRKACSRVA